MSQDVITEIGNDIVKVKFTRRPNFETIKSLKENGFRWYQKNEFWYANTTPQRTYFAKQLSGELAKNLIIKGNCLNMMPKLADSSVDLVITDPSDLSGSKGKTIQTVFNYQICLVSAFQEIYRLLKTGGYSVIFCGRKGAEFFIPIVEFAGFNLIDRVYLEGELCTTKTHVKSKEEVLVLVKGSPYKPYKSLGSLIPWRYSGNILHPSQAHTDTIAPFIKSFSIDGDLVLDPFCGSGSTCASAKKLGRSYLGIEKDKNFAETAKRRLSL